MNTHKLINLLQCRLQRFCVFTVNVCFMLLCCSAVSNTALAGTPSNASAWLAATNGSLSNGFMIERVHSIFNKVKRMGGSAALQSKLYIINSDSVPWAIALQDKNIILSRGAIDVIYGSNDSLDARDARMAFVLGHELKHVIDNDFWHESVYHSFAEGENVLIEDELLLSRRKEQELRADEEGFIYATLAGFSTKDIFSAVGNEQNFLEYWAQQTNTGSGKGHHSPASRIKFLHDRFKSLDNSVEFYKFGVRLAHFGRYEDARVLLEEFYKVYPSTQVLNNLGYVHLQLAREEMNADQAYQYWFPTLLELGSGFPNSSGRNLQTGLSAAATAHLETAVDLLKRGADLQSGVQDHLSRINLITAYLYLEQYSAARATLESISNWESNFQLLGLDALIVMQDKRLKDPWDTYSREKFAELAASNLAEDNIIYNYARLLEQRGRHGQAKQYWHRLKDKFDNLPRNYQIMVCRELVDDPECGNAIPEFRVRHQQWDLDIKPGDDIDSAMIRKKLSDWGQPFKESLAAIDAVVYRHPNGNAVLAIDGIIELVSIKQHGFDFKDHLRQVSGSPMVELDTGTEEIWSYGEQWSAVISDNVVREIWIAQ